jgi:hypothetical protein
MAGKLRKGGVTMAIMRCEVHEPHGRERNYVRHVEPVGYPNTALVCGSITCTKPALIWLEADESAAFDRGERVFKSFTATMKVRAA